MTSNIEAYILRVTNIQAEKTFWRDAVGLKVVSESEDETATDVVMRAPFGGGSVQLRKIKGDDSPVDLGHSIFRQYLNTSDSAGLHKRAVSLGYDNAHEPFDVPGRVNVVKSYTRQPSGYLIDLCEFQGPPGLRIQHGQIDAKEHAAEGDIATYVGPTAIYVSSMDAAADFWTRCGATIMDRVEMRGYMEITQMRGLNYGVVLQLMEIKGTRPPMDETLSAEEKAQAERTAAVMPQPGKVDLGTGLQGFRVATDDCRALHDEVVAGGYRSLSAPTESDIAITAKVADPDGYPVEILQRVDY